MSNASRPRKVPTGTRGRWGTPEWRADAERWATRRLAALGIRPTGPISDLSIQPWSAVWRIHTTAGPVVLKQTTPDRVAEIAAHEFCAAIAPEYVDEPLAYDVDSARLLLTDGGPTLHETSRQDSLEVAATVLRDYAGLQRATIGHDERAAAAGIPTWDPASAAEEVEWQARTLHAMPSTDIRQIGTSQRDHLLGRLDTYRHAAGILADSGVPDCLDQGDLWPGNVLVPVERGSGLGHFRFIDFGDAAWTHPFLGVLPFLHYYHQRWAPTARSFDLDRPELRHLTDVYLRAWADHGPPSELVTRFRAATCLAPLRRSRAAIVNVEHAGSEDRHELGPTPWAWLTSTHPAAPALLSFYGPELPE